MKNITLTATELEQIESQRKMQAELDAKRDIAFGQQFTKAIALKTEQKNNHIKQSNEQVAAATQYAKELGLQVTITNHDYSLKAVRQTLDGSEGEVWMEDYSCPEATIVDGDYRIQVRMHTVYSRWSSRGTQKGYKMYISGPKIDHKTSSRGYVNTKKVVEVIAYAKECVESARQYEINRKSAIETAQSMLQAQFPDATVATSREHRHNPYSKKNPYTYYDAVTVVLPNGISVVYQVYADGTMTRIKVEFPNTEAVDFITAMSNLKF